MIAIAIASAFALAAILAVATIAASVARGLAQGRAILAEMAELERTGPAIMPVALPALRHQNFGNRPSRNRLSARTSVATPRACAAA